MLASLGLLEGRKATAHAGFQDKLAGAEVLDTEAVVDGNITTSYGLGGAIPFLTPQVRAGLQLAIAGIPALPVDAVQLQSPIPVSYTHLRVEAYTPGL